MKTTLVVIYNHCFPGNIEKIERYYKGNFTSIFHVIPFHMSSQDNIIPVFEVSYMFAGHIAAAWSRIIKTEAEYFAFIGDDLLLNPRINEINLHNEFHVNPNTAYIDQHFTLDNVSAFWRRAVEAINWSPKRKGVEIPIDFPTAEMMLEKLRSLEHTSLIVPRKAVQRNLDRPRGRDFFEIIKSNIWSARWNAKYSLRRNRTMNYPVVGGYSDIVVVPQKFTREFSRMCGIFNTLGLHTELAIPTTLRYLFRDSISTADNSGISRLIAWDGNKAIQFEEFEQTIENLRANFPKNVSYAHPVKLSQWY